MCLTRLESWYSDREGKLLSDSWVRGLKSPEDSLCFLYCSKMQLYQYSDLPSHDSIRLIRFRSGRAGELSISLDIVELSSAISYDVLSYRWGDPNDSVTIDCDGRPLRISRSLYDALCELKDGYAVDVIWADQICINQDNLAEKSVQVQLMHKIYSGSRMCWAWLGAATTDAERAINIIHDYFVGSHVNFLDRILQPEKLTAAGEASKIPERSSERFELVHAFFRQEWFHRMWIVQEVCLSKTVQLVCGPHCLEWDDFGKAIDSFRAHYPGLDDTEPAYNLSRRTQGEAWSALGMLDDCRVFEATDPRDKIYALLALKRSLGVIPDYTKSVESVFVDAAVAIVEGLLENEACTAPLQILCTASQIEETASKAGALPSWVPDWRDADFDKHGDFAYIQANTKIHSRAPPPTITVDQRLVVHGSMMAEIKEVQPISDQSEGASAITKLFQALKFVEAHRSSLHGLDLDDLLTTATHTASAGRFRILTMPRLNLQKLFALIYIKLATDGAEATSWMEIEMISKAVELALNANVSERTMASTLGSHLQQFVDTGLKRRKLAITVSGQLALVPRYAQPGDRIVVLCASNFPVVLRPKESNEWQHMGMGYLDGVSMGEITAESLGEVEEFIIR